MEFFVEALDGFDGFHDCFVDFFVELEFHCGRPLEFSVAGWSVFCF